MNSVSVTCAKVIVMSTQADQKFMAVAAKEPGEMPVYKIDNEKNE
jgi:hypothetical protein